MAKSTGWHVAIIVLLVIVLLALLFPGKKSKTDGGCGCCDRCKCKSFMPISKEPYCGSRESYY